MLRLRRDGAPPELLPQNSYTPENRKLYPLQAGASKPVVGRGQPLKVNDELGVNSAVPGEGEVVAVDGAGADLDSVARCWEAEAREPGAQVTYVKGRLRERLQFWRDEIEAPASVLDTIEGGYVLPLMSQPTPFSCRNHKSTSLHAEFVQQSVADFLAGNCIKEVPGEPFICSSLSVVESSGGKKRLVINLRHLNRFLWKQKFKYEDLQVAMLLFERGDYLFSFDLKSGYHHVDIAPPHCKYLGFAWEGHFYVFTVLPFGLSSACYMFTKLLRPLVRYWRAKGLRILVCLDDGLCAVAGRQKALEASELVRTTLARAGFVVHLIKSIWEPIRRLPWLGFVVDLELGQIDVPQAKLTALQHMLDHACWVAQIPARYLASIIGKIISMGLAIGPVSRFMTCSVYATLDQHVFPHHDFGEVK